MKVFAVDLLAQAGDRAALRTLQVPAPSMDQALERARKSMNPGESEVRANTTSAPKPVGRLLDIKV